MVFKRNLLFLISGFFLLISLAGTVILVKQSQEIREEAAEQICNCGGIITPCGTEHCNTQECNKYRCTPSGWEKTCDNCCGNCGQPQCGNGTCDPGENCDNCRGDCEVNGDCSGGGPRDCSPACEAGQICCNGRCYNGSTCDPSVIGITGSASCEITGDHKFKVSCQDIPEGVSGHWAGCSNNTKYQTLAQCNSSKTGVGCPIHEFHISCDGQMHEVGSWGPEVCTFYQEDLKVYYSDGRDACGRAEIKCWDGDWSVCVPPLTPTPTLTPIPTPTPAYSCRCSVVKMYDLQWNQITDFSLLRPGVEVFLTVSGTTDHPVGLTKGRLRINPGGNWRETTTAHDGEFYIRLRIPDYGNYSAEGQIYNPSCGWQ